MDHFLSIAIISFLEISINSEGLLPHERVKRRNLLSFFLMHGSTVKNPCDMEAFCLYYVVF